uniref:tRNA (guanine(37)-N1)-methyltransferase n=1 Tax=Anopheles dirus TaxID=7168 RepID=A0A182N8A5_9DIPT
MNAGTKTVLLTSHYSDAHRVLVRLRHYFKNMLCPDLHPPPAVRGMTQLDRGAFSKTIKVPHLLVPKEKNLNDVCRSIKKYLLKMERYKPVVTDEYKITLHPLAVQKWEDLADVQLEKLDIGSEALVWQEIQLSYDNWKYDEIFKAVLPIDKEALSSFSKIGHIIHLNLKEHLLPYKELIGEVIRDKIADCRTVVNKSLSIDNTYRNFQMELLCGEPDYRVSVKENGCLFAFDFSKVYWNPRLSTEHEKIAKMLHKNDALYDVYAGVGPFAVPAARKGCRVLANDLNPDSYQALVRDRNRFKMAKKANKMKDQPKQLAKKAKTVFTVSQGKKSNLKKAKEVTSNLKKINVQDKREKLDNKFQDLHAKIVSKKAPKPASKPLPAKNKTKPDTKKLETDLNEMQM